MPKPEIESQTSSDTKSASALSEHPPHTPCDFVQLVSSWENYHVRPVQIRMMQAVAEALHHEHHLLVEAGTGAGKSFGYLLPSLLHHI